MLEVTGLFHYEIYITITGEKSGDQLGLKTPLLLAPHQPWSAGTAMRLRGAAAWLNTKQAPLLLLIQPPNA